MKRKVSIHDVKRRLLHKMAGVSSYEVTRIIRELREYAIAREFMNGRSFEALEADATLGRHVWSRGEIEQAVRNKARMGAR